MKDLIHKTIEFLKTRIKQNLTEIRQNQHTINSLINLPATDNRRRQLDSKYDCNKELLSENYDFINLQLNLVTFLEKYKGILSEDMEFEPSFHQSEHRVFEKTINGEMPYNNEHPHYYDDSFFHKLLKYYEKDEQYELCHKLLISRIFLS